MVRSADPCSRWVTASTAPIVSPPGSRPVTLAAPRIRLAVVGGASSPTASRILGAAKVTGRLPGGLTIGAVDAVTQREHGSADRTIEPFTNYAVLRAQQDYRNGQSGIGFLGTAVNRNLDQWSEAYLRDRAYVGAVDFRHRFSKGRYELSGSFDVSSVSGSPAAIALTQQNQTHNYQRPADQVTFDPNRTSLSGDAEELLFT